MYYRGTPCKLARCYKRFENNTLPPFSNLQFKAVTTNPYTEIKKGKDKVIPKNPQHAFLRRGSKAVGPMS